MKLTLRSQDLARELSLAQGVLDKKSTVPALGNVLMEAKGEMIQLTATDLELGLRTSCDAAVATAGSTTVPIRRLYEYVRLLPDAEMSIASSATDSISLACGSAKTRIAGLDAKNFPKLAAPPESWARIDTTLLLAAIKRTIISVAGEQSHYTLAGAQIEIRRDRVGIVSTDGHRLSLYFEEQEDTGVTEDVRGLMPRKAMGELQKVLELAEGTDEEPASVYFADDANNMYFRSGRRLLITRKMTGKFPDYDRVMPRDLGISLELDGEKLAAVLRRVSQFADERSRAVRFDLEDGKLQMTATVSQFGSSEESLLVDYEGDPVSVGFNSLYIIEFLQVCESEKALMRLKDQRGAAQFEVPGLPAGKDFRYVIMPIRV